MNPSKTPAPQSVASAEDRIYEKHLRVMRTARYYMMGNVSAELQSCWMVCHGYGQLAGSFIKRFQHFEKGKHLIIAPEGLSRFYVEGLSGKVGATWMTKADRKHEIRDYIDYLDTLISHIRKETAAAAPRLNLLGFSQGASTICRWVCHSRAPIDNLIIWAGEIPPDLDFSRFKAALKNVGLYMVCGKYDPYITEERIAQQQQLLQENGIGWETITYEGSHEIDSVVLKELRSKCT